MAKKPLILIAEDDADARQMISRFLARRGFKTLCAANGKEALEHIISSQPDLFILDIMMPELNGVDLLKKIRNNLPLERWKPVIITTGFPEIYHNNCFNDTLDILITKPCLMSEIFNAVHQVIKQHASQNSMSS